MEYPRESILVVGSARPSREDAIYATHGEFYISLVLDRGSGEILDVGCNTIVGVTAAFVRQLLVGRRLTEDLAGLEEEIRGRYFALTQKPLIAALKDAANRYRTAVKPEI